MSYLLVIGTVQAFFTALFFAIKRDRSRSDIVITLFMSIVIVSFFSEMIRIGIINAPWLNFLSLVSYSTLFGPCIYLYTKSNIEPKLLFSRTSFLHLIPFLILTFLFSYQTLVVEQRDIFKAPPRHGLRTDVLYRQKPGFESAENERPYLRPPDNQLRLADKQNVSSRLTDPSAVVAHKNRGRQKYFILSGRSINLILSIVILLAYCAAVLKLLRRHRQKIVDFYSYNDGRITLQWLMIITISFAVIYTYVHLVSLLGPFLFRHALLEPIQTYTSGTILFIYIFSFFAIKQPPLYSIKDPVNDEKRYEKSGLKDEDAERFLSEIIHYMDEEKPYLDGDLTINMMADELDISRHYITQVLNSKLSKNFYAFINEYRFNEAKQRLICPEFNEQTVLQIAFDSGFNSKSVFNSTFKKLTDLTPTMYRRLHQK